MNSRIKALAAITATLFGALALATPAQAAPPPTDPQIVGIVIAANQIDIDHAKIALSKSKNKQVREFAQQMVTDHTAVQKSVFALGAKLHVTPADSDTSNSLKNQAAETTTKLNALSGKAFDKFYVDSEVSYHQAVINALTTVLIPNAQNAELKSALQGALPIFQGHLQHAQTLQATLAGSSNTSMNMKQ
jgi:putative membrane protein